MNDLVVGVALGGGEIELTGRDHGGPRVVPLVWANTEQSKRRVFAGQRVFLLVSAPTARTPDHYYDI